MMKKLLLFFAAIAMTACGALKPTTCSVQPTFYKYRYVYIMPTGSVIGSTAVSTSYVDNRVHGGVTRTTNPSDMMSGVLMQKGFTILPQLDQNKLAETLVLSYGETGHRDVGFLWLSTSTGIIIQFRDAQTNELIASAEAEDYGSTEADNVRYAIQRALDAIFAQPRY
jgi:hypothetical protein